MLELLHPPGLEVARRYAATLLVEHLWNYSGPWRLRVDPEATTWRLHVVGQPGELRLADRFFPAAAHAWLAPTVAPPDPLPRWRLPESLAAELLAPELPILFGAPEVVDRALTTSETAIELAIDVLGSLFWLATDYDAASQPDRRDRYGRFLARDARLGRAGLLLRPLAHEYAELLWLLARRLWPGLRRRERSFRIVPTHDVDEPYAWRLRPWPQVLRRSLGRLRHGEPSAALAIPLTRAGWRHDPYDTFAWLLAQAEQAGNVAHFFLLCDGSRYDPAHPRLRRLWEEIRRRGHRLGLHAGHAAAEAEGALAAERARCARLLGEPPEGVRQHYLRFDPRRSWRRWADAGFAWDTSVAFADHVGFRTGLAIPYPTFDLERRTPLPLLERPLLLMEVSLLEYMRLEVAAARTVARELVAATRWARGEFVFLWHNDRLATPEARAFCRWLHAGCP